MNEEQILDMALAEWEKINNSDPIERVLLMNVVQGLLDAMSPHGTVFSLQHKKDYSQWSGCVSGKMHITLPKDNSLDTTCIEFDLWPCKSKSAVRFTQRKAYLDTGAWVRKSTKTFTIDHTPESINQWFEDVMKFTVKTIRNRG